MHQGDRGNLRFIRAASSYFQRSQHVVGMFLRRRRWGRDPQLTAELINLLKYFSEWEHQRCPTIPFRSSHTRIDKVAKQVDEWEEAK